MNEAVLWTDSRYYLQAKKQLCSKWTITQTAKKKVIELITIFIFNILIFCLASSKIELVPLIKNLVDELWFDRPQYPALPIFIHDEKYAGESLMSKVTRVRENITQLNVDALVITALDEIAWLLNLRGSDIPFTPVFISYVLLTKNATSLYLKQEVTHEIKDYLQRNNIQYVISSAVFPVT
ncbi:hypothetical protein AAG570_002533 [Ranatra chinensis]|uniref:Uncharacterized protein n=1 Tax=Ranatra chinensis TaxID=642074 RepID=A0ABD0Y7U3_9HEMI